MKKEQTSQDNKQTAEQHWKLILANLERMKLLSKHSGVTGEITRHGSDDTARRPPSMKAALSVLFGQQAPHHVSTQGRKSVEEKDLTMTETVAMRWDRDRERDGLQNGDIYDRDRDHDGDRDGDWERIYDYDRHGGGRDCIDRDSH